MQGKKYIGVACLTEAHQEHAALRACPRPSTEWGQTGAVVLHRGSGFAMQGVKKKKPHRGKTRGCSLPDSSVPGACRTLHAWP